MIRYLEPGRFEGSIDGGSDLREERGRVRRREVGLQGRLLLPLLEEQKGAGVIGRSLATAVNVIKAWTYEHIEELEQARDRYDQVAALAR
jgi:predicted outer membrane lipoprotein